MYKCKKKISPKFFHNMYSIKQTKYPLRQKNQVIEPAGKITNSVKFSISYRCPYVWNKIMANEEKLKNDTSLNSFKSYIKKLILSNQNITIFF